MSMIPQEESLKTEQRQVPCAIMYRQLWLEAEKCQALVNEANACCFQLDSLL